MLVLVKVFLKILIKEFKNEIEFLVRWVINNILKAKMVRRRDLRLLNDIRMLELIE